MFMPRFPELLPQLIPAVEHNITHVTEKVICSMLQHLPEHTFIYMSHTRLKSIYQHYINAVLAQAQITIGGLGALIYMITLLIATQDLFFMGI
jgi:hypothetical protein